MKKKLIEMIGWYGVVAILLAYALVSFGCISSKGYVYQLLNLTGALGVLVISIIKKAHQPAVLNFAWAVIAFIAIISLILQR